VAGCALRFGGVPIRSTSSGGEPVRILLTTDVAGGVWSYTEELYDALVGRSHEVALVSLGGEPSRGQRLWLRSRPELLFTALPHALEWMPEPEPSLSRSADALRSAADRFRPDVIHLNQFFYGASDLGAPKLVVAHSDVVSWWRAVKAEEPPADAWFHRYRGWVEAGLAGAGARAAPSGWMARQAMEIYGAAPVEVVHNARSPARFPRGTATRDPVAVTAGRLWDEGKGVGDMVAAAALLERRRRAELPAPVVVAGPARHPAGGRDFPTRSPGLRWAGILPSDGMTALLRRAAVYVATSRYEPFGLAPLEAALSGCALVMTNIPTFRELWDGAALFYEPGDSAALAEILRKLLDAPGRREPLADAAYARALDRFAPDRMAAAYETIYRRLQAASPNPPSPAERRAGVERPEYDDRGPSTED
jgi:glycogen synthase